MGISKEEARQRAAAAYNAAADLFDAPALSFWDRFGRSTVARLELRPGERVLDVCSGSGASALPAAERVGPGGRVLAVDLAGNLLELARRKAERQGLANVGFRVGDFQELGLPDGSFDAVVCVFGIFFVPDMPRAVRELWRMLRPGGRLAVTTWGPRFFEPANGVFWEAVRAERPDLYKGFSPWDRISDPVSLRHMLEEGGAGGAEVVAEAAEHPIPSPEDWWTVLMGSGYRGTIEQLGAEARERVRQVNLDFLRSRGIRAVEANVLYAVARKPA